MTYSHVAPEDEAYGLMMRAVLNSREQERRKENRDKARDDQRRRCLGYLIERMRTAAGFSQRDLAESMGTTQSSISRWESGTQLPSLNSLNVIAQVTGFDLLIGARGRGEQIDGSPMGREIDPNLLVMGYVVDEAPMAELWLVANSTI
jgi:transcriptional regulator with XRE-family HTH domain